MSRALLVLVAFVAAACGASETEPLATRSSAPIAFLRDDRELVTVDLDSGNERIVAQDSRGIAWYSWSPDGRQLVYRRGASSLVAVELDGGEKTIARMPRGHVIQSYSWSPDGRQILLSVDTPYHNWIDIYVVELEGRGSRRIKRTNVYTTHPEWSPRGDAILIDDNNDGGHTLWVVKPDGSAARKLLNDEFGVGWPAWSPDGKQIAYGDEIRGWILLINADGSGRKRITRAESTHPVWAPSKTIMFGDGEDESWIVNPDGNGRRRATMTEALFHDVPPDQQTVVTWSSKVFRGEQDLFLMSRDGRSRKLTDNEKDDCCATLAPDGKSLVFLRHERPWTPQTKQGPGDIFVINADGSGERNLTDSPEHESDPVWAPGG